MPIAPGYQLESETNTGLAYGGLAILGIPYVAGLVAAAGSGFPKQSSWLAVPVAGPFIAMGGRKIDCSFTSITTNASIDLNQREADCRKSAMQEARVVALLTVAGLIQTAGLLVTIAGLATSDEYLVRKDLLPKTNPEKPQVTLDGGVANGLVRLSAQVQF